VLNVHSGDSVGNGSGRSLTGAGAGRGCRPPPPPRVYMLSYIRCLRRGTCRHYKYKEPQPNSCPRLFVSRRLCHRPPAYLSSTWSTPTTRLYPVGTVIRDVLRSILLDPVLCECDLSGGPGVGRPQDDRGHPGAAVILPSHRRYIHSTPVETAPRSQVLCVMFLCYAYKLYYRQN
jgi:hypothetical protein